MSTPEKCSPSKTSLHTSAGPSQASCLAHSSATAQSLSTTITRSWPLCLSLQGNQQRPLQGSTVAGPFIYFVLDDRNRVFYVGKSKENHVLKRWIRPGKGGPAHFYWTHSTRAGGCVFNIAEGLREGLGPYHLRFVPLATLRAEHADALGIDDALSEDEALGCAERILIRVMNPKWNRA